MVVNENMAAAARIHGIERGKDLRAYPLFAFGGAGPVHAWHVGRILKVPRVLVPFGAGAASALGLLAAPLAFDFVRTASQRLDGADWAGVNRLFAEMEAEGRAVLREAGVADADMRFRRTAEMRYAGQGHEVEGPVPAGALGAGEPRRPHHGLRGRLSRALSPHAHGRAIEALNWRVVVSGPAPGDFLPAQRGPRRMAAASPSRGRPDQEAHDPRISPRRGLRRHAGVRSLRASSRARASTDRPSSRSASPPR